MDATAVKYNHFPIIELSYFRKIPTTGLLKVPGDNNSPGSIPACLSVLGTHILYYHLPHLYQEYDRSLRRMLWRLSQVVGPQYIQ